jgi:hypothetical protein
LSGALAGIGRFVLRKIDILDAATRIDDLRSPPGNRREPLKATMARLRTHPGEILETNIWCRSDGRRVPWQKTWMFRPNV